MADRNTIQKQLILDAVQSLKSHATADEVYRHIRKLHPNISKGTVYRNLNKLADIGEIKKVEVPGDVERFDHICTSHYHVKCTECGKIFDVEMDYIHDLDKKIRNTNGFVFNGHDIIFQGICPNCISQKQ